MILANISDNFPSQKSQAMQSRTKVGRIQQRLFNNSYNSSKEKSGSEECTLSFAWKAVGRYK